LRRVKKQGFTLRKIVVFWDVVWKASFPSIFFGIDPKKKQKKSRPKNAASALFLRLEKLEKTSKSFFCFSTAPKFTPPLARLLPMATALNKESFNCLRLCGLRFYLQYSIPYQPHPFFVSNRLKKLLDKKAPLERGQEFKTT
jgi:hypothetical protein